MNELESCITVFFIGCNYVQSGLVIKYSRSWFRRNTASGITNVPCFYISLNLMGTISAGWQDNETEL